MALQDGRVAFETQRVVVESYTNLDDINHSQPSLGSLTSADGGLTNHHSKCVGVRSALAKASHIAAGVTLAESLASEWVHPICIVR